MGKERAKQLLVEINTVWKRDVRAKVSQAEKAA